MMHIQKIREVKTYIPREYSANQNVAIVGERNDEDHAVPSVMKLIEKLTDEEVDDVSVPLIPERIVEVVTAFHWSESQN